VTNILEESAARQKSPSKFIKNDNKSLIEETNSINSKKRINALPATQFGFKLNSIVTDTLSNLSPTRQIRNKVLLAPNPETLLKEQIPSPRVYPGIQLKPMDI
jgi:hypothetical protein